MGNDLTKGTTYVDGGMINAANLNAHVDDATFNSTCISARTAKTPAAVTDEFLINDSGTLKKVTGTTLYDMFTQTGAVIQSTHATNTAWHSSNAVIPPDNTIPQIGEGIQNLTLSFTPRFVNSKMVCRLSGGVTSSVVGSAIAAIFRNSVANAIASTIVYCGTAGALFSINLIAIDLPVTVATLTYSVRIGPAAAATIYVNGSNASQYFGATMGITLEVQEVRVP